jgi:parallel beta-helix repeat protein
MNEKEREPLADVTRASELLPEGDRMKVVMQRGLLLALTLISTMAMAAVPHQDANFDATKLEAFKRKNRQYTSVEQEGKTPGPWQLGSWGEGAMSEAALVADAGDGKPTIKFVNISGQPSLMFKPWTELSLGRGSWEARVEYRKDGKASGRLHIDGPDNKKYGIDLLPTATFKTVAVPFEVGGNGANIGAAFQLYGGIGPEEALFVRSFTLVRVGDVGAETKAAEEQANAALIAEAQVVADREAARREIERKPINGWVRPEAKPVPMTKPLDPPPVTGKTYFVATTGNNEGNDGSQAKPWRSIQHGMNQLHPGDRLYIRGGEYRESMLTLARSGKADAYITVAGYPGEQVKVINAGGLAVFNLDTGSPWTPKRLREEAYIVFRDLYVDAVQGNQAFRINGPMMLPEYSNNVVKSRGLVHNIWIVNCEIVGGGPAEGGVGAGFGAHDIVFSNNRIRTKGGMNSFLYSDGTIIEWNTVHNTSEDHDDAGAIKSMAPGVIIRYNTVHGNKRNPLSKRGGWAPDSEGGSQWRFLQGVTGIYLDWAMVTPRGGNNYYPAPLVPKDPANYVYGNKVYDNNAGIYAFLSDNAQIFNNEVYDNGHTNSGGWVEGKEGGRWLEFIGPAGYGIAVTGSKNLKVIGNLVYNNPKAGLTTEDVPALEAYNNVLFGNKLAQVHFRKGGSGAVGFNTILDTGKQGAPFRWKDDDFATAEALRAKYPYLDEGTTIVPLKAGADPLATARQLQKSGSVSAARWAQARESLVAKALAAGIGVPPTTVPQAAFDPTRSLQAPLPWRVPGNVEFENYDVGGPDVSFKDNDGDNQGGHYRKDAVDIKADKAAGNGAVVGFTQNGEWMEYTISVAKAGNYRLSVAYAAPEAGKSIRLSLNGKPLGEAIAFAPTASWNDMKTVDAGTVALPAGDSVLRVTIGNGPVDLDRMQFQIVN